MDVYIYIAFCIEIPVRNSVDPDLMLIVVASDLRMHYLHNTLK